MAVETDQESTQPAAGNSRQSSVDLVQDILSEICEATGLDMDAEYRGSEGSFLQFELVGADAEECFGKIGKSLDGMQYLVNLVVARRLESGPRVMLDAGGYRGKRIEALTKMALEYAAEVAERQEECELESLPSNERRIVHNALTDHPDVITYSEGEEPDRRIVIAPRK